MTNREWIKQCQEYNNRIPSRREFHQVDGGFITLGDFDTEHPTGYVASRIISCLLRTGRLYKDEERQRKSGTGKFSAYVKKGKGNNTDCLKYVLKSLSRNNK